MAVSPKRTPPWKACLAAALATGLGACASAPQEFDHGAWQAAEIAGAPVDTVLLTSAMHPVAKLNTASVRALIEVLRRLEQFSGTNPAELVIAAGGSANAFVHHARDGTVITVNLAMLWLLGDDADAWAALLGHELAHVSLAHSRTRSEREAARSDASDAIALLLAVVGVPLGAVLADTSTVAVERAYTREEELAADETGLRLMVQAGFDAQGATRLQEKLAGAAEGGVVPLFSTHPAGGERVAAMRRLVEGMRAPAAD